jgi:hypothetical protein
MEESKLERDRREPSSAQPCRFCLKRSMNLFSLVFLCELARHTDQPRRHFASTTRANLHSGAHGATETGCVTVTARSATLRRCFDSLKSDQHDGRGDRFLRRVHTIAFAWVSWFASWLTTSPAIGRAMDKSTWPSRACVSLLALALALPGCGGGNAQQTLPTTGADAGRAAPAAASGSVSAANGGHSPDATPVPSGAGMGAVSRDATGTAGAAGAAGAGAAMPDAGVLPPFDAGSDPNRNQVSVGMLCDRLAALQCAAEVHCCQTARAFDACKPARVKDCQSTNLDEIAGQPSSGFSATMTASEFAHLEQLASSCDLGVRAWGSAPDGLRGIFQGTLAPDQSCAPPAGPPSVVGYGAALVACKDPATHACLFSGVGPPAPPSAATCASRAGAGTRCFGDANCEEELYCANASMTYSGGMCTQRKPLGSACSHGIECASRFCNHTSATCVEPNAQQAYCMP